MRIKVVLLIISQFVLSTWALFAQIDIDSLYNKTPNFVIQTLGEPSFKDFGDKYMAAATLFYQNSRFYFDESEGEWWLDCFETDSNDFCILSDCFEEGIKVGDSFQRINNLDFVNCKYGNHKSGNSLKRVSNAFRYKPLGHLVNYVVFEEEPVSFYFSVCNGVIVAIAMKSKEVSTWTHQSVQIAD